MFRRLIIVAGAMLVLTMVLAACGEDEQRATPTQGTGAPSDPTATQPAPEEPELAGTSWLLSGFSDRDLDTDLEVTLIFDDNQATGSAGCNDYDAEYTSSTDGSLSFGDIITTDMHCEIGMDIEREFLEALGNTEGYTADDTRLELTDASGAMLVFFTRHDAAAEGLDDTSWLLEELQGESVPDDIEVTLRFETGEQAGGSAGCNSYGASYEQPAGGEITFIEIVQTEMYCDEPEGVMDVEIAFTSALRDVAGYRMSGDRLTLLNVDGNELLVFSRDDHAAEFPLDGTRWIVTELNGKPLIEGTEITVEFEDGRIVGSAGCNWYGGDYHSDASGEITTLEIESTLMACMEPDGVMDQEAEFLAALHEVAAYRESAGEVELLDKDGTARIVLGHADEPRANIDLQGTTWVLMAIDGRPIQSDLPYTLHFTVNGPVGKAGCMTWWMAFRTEPDGTITHDQRVPFSTYDAFCNGDEDAISEAEAYVETLSNSIVYVANDDHLQLMDDTGMITLEFQRGLDGGELDGTSWVLTDLDGNPVLDGTNLTLSFDFEWATGEGGCNGFGGPFTVTEPGTIVFASVGHTDIGCLDPDGIMHQETAYFDALYRVTGYVMTDDSLELLDAAGETILTYEAGPELYGLGDGLWTLITMNGEPVLLDASPNLGFHPYGISGWSGCNIYVLHWDSITLDETSMVIGHVGSEQQDCDETIAQQEREYFDTLTEVESYRISGSSLELMNASGETILIFRRAS